MPYQRSAHFGNAGLNDCLHILNSTISFRSRAAADAPIKVAAYFQILVYVLILAVKSQRHFIDMRLRFDL